MTAMCQAWQAREIHREKLLQAIRLRIMEQEEDIGRAKLNQVLLYRLARRIESGKKDPDTCVITMIPGMSRKQAVNMENLFREISEKIEQFDGPDVEKSALFAQLLEETAAEIARPYHSALRDQTTPLLRRIYRVERDTDEVPLK